MFPNDFRRDHVLTLVFCNWLKRIIVQRAQPIRKRTNTTRGLIHAQFLAASLLFLIGELRYLRLLR